MLRKEVILRDARRFRWLAQQCDEQEEKAFYLGAAIALEQTIGYSTREQNRIELSFEHDIKRRQKDETIIWNRPIDGDPFPISEEDWQTNHQKPIIGLNDIYDEKEIEQRERMSKRHDRIR